MSDQPLKATTPASEWIESARGEVKRLPSGKVARLVHPDVLDLMMQDGSIPDIVAGFMAKSNDDLNETEQIAALATIKPLLDKITLACFVEPRVVEGEPNPDAGEIGIQHVLTTDKLWLFQEMFGGLQSLTGLFPGQPGGNVVTTPSLDQLRAEAKLAYGADAGD